jgi:hypothetical protein
MFVFRTLLHLLHTSELKTLLQAPSFRSLSYYSSIASSKASSHTVQSNDSENQHKAMEDWNNPTSQNSVTHMHLKTVVFLVVTPCSGVLVCRSFCFLHHEHSSPTLMINASLAPEMSIHVHQTTRCHIPGHCNIYSHLRENIKFNLTINKHYGRLCLASYR